MRIVSEVYTYTADVSIGEGRRRGIEDNVHYDRNEERQKREPGWLDVRFKSRRFYTVVIM